MASCLRPETYYATTKSGVRISETAKDANSDVDYPSIEAACDTIATTLKDELNKISKAIANVQIGKEALCVSDKSMQPVVDEVSDFVKGLPEAGGITSFLDEVKTRALEEHNRIQKEYNEAAESKVKSRASSEA